MPSNARRSVMSIDRRAAPAIVAACIASVCQHGAWAQTYPTKPVRVIIATSAGSNPDIIARVLAHGLTQMWGQQVIIDNRAGAGGNIGADMAAKAPPDGYTLLHAHTNLSINVSLYRKLSYDL